MEDHSDDDEDEHNDNDNDEEEDDDKPVASAEGVCPLLPRLDLLRIQCPHHVNDLPPTQLLDLHLRDSVLPEDRLGVLERQLPEIGVRPGDCPLGLGLLLLLVGRFVGYLDVAEPFLSGAGGVCWPSQLQQTLALHGLHVGPGGVPGGALDLVVHLQVVVVIVLLRQDELVPLSGILEPLLRHRHGVVGGAMLGVHHAPDDQDDQDKDNGCELPDILLRGQPEAGLHDTRVRVRSRLVELRARLQSLPDRGLSGRGRPS